MAVLVVDDDETNRDLLVRRLVRSAYSVQTAYGGVQAQTLIEQQRFDLVLLDTMMPGVSGLQVLEWIRARDDCRDLAVIMTTAKAQSEDVVEALALGADDYVTKPIDFPVLLARIKTQLASRARRQELVQGYDERERRGTRASGVVERVAPPGSVERKFVTVLFSDLIGYTEMSEKLDPEEVREIMTELLGSAHAVIRNHGGSTEKFMGDAIMAVFGMQETYADDPVRAINAAVEIHRCVDAQAITDSLKRRIGRGLSMHTGISSGLVIINPGSLYEGAESIFGDAVNLAARVSNLAKSGQILVSSETFQLTEGYFNFEQQRAVSVKGVSKPVSTYKLVSSRSRPSSIHRLSGRRSKLIGRESHLAELDKAFRIMADSKGTTVLLQGSTGTGKSRLLEEFRNELEAKPIQWLQGNAFQNMGDVPYSLFIDFLRRFWQIRESDTPAATQEKLAKEIEQLIGNQDMAPYLGYLFGLEYPQTENISPQFWKTEFVRSMHRLIEALCQQTPSIICFEDIQWADHASLHLLLSIVTDMPHHGLLICSYTPPIKLFDDQLNSTQEDTCREIVLSDLSHAQVEAMLGSLLNTASVPPRLVFYIEEKGGGNPFFIEELVNTLVESGLLVDRDGVWSLNRLGDERRMPSSIQGVISARLDHLDKDNMAVLQEAAVIGKKFRYSLLRRISRYKDELDACLEYLQQGDLIHRYSNQSETEYVFKHALIRQAVYDSLLLDERKELHQLIAQTIEFDFAGQLADYYETLATHYRHAGSKQKCVDYLLLSARKSLRRHAVDEAHHFFNEAFDLLVETAPGSKAVQTELVKVLTQWAVVYFYRGDFEGLLKQFNRYKDMAESLDDQATLGLFYAWFGKALYCSDSNSEARHYLNEALRIGELGDDSKIVGYACSSLLFTCKDSGSLVQATAYGNRALQASEHIQDDPVVFTRTLVGLGDVYFFRGKVSKVFEVGNRLAKYVDQYPGSGQADTSSHVCIGLAHSCAGDFVSAIASFEQALKSSVSPFFSQWPKLWLANAYVLNHQFDDADRVLRELDSFCRENGVHNLITLTEALTGVVLCHKEQTERGLELLRHSRDSFLKKESTIFYVCCEYFLGRVYLRILQQARRNHLKMLGKDVRYLFGTVLSAGQHAKTHFKTAIAAAAEMSASGLRGPALLDLARLYALQGSRSRARKYFREAIEQFRESEATIYLEVASRELRSVMEEGV